MKKYTVVGFYKNNMNGWVMGEFNNITDASREIEDEWELNPEVDIDYYVIMKSEEAVGYKNYW